jgi:CheY-like chemotaxis protein
MQFPGTKIFLLEDNPLYQTLLIKHLEGISPDVQVYGTGERFLAAVLADVPDLVVLDYNLEGEMNGYDVLREIKKLPAPPPVIFFSSNLEIPVTASILKLGIVKYIEKNIFAFPHLKHCINDVLNADHKVHA